MKQIVVPTFAATFVAGGGRDIDTARTPELAALAAGEHVRLVDDRDEEVGLAIADPDNQRLRVMATPKDGLVKIDGTLLALRVERAVAWRRQLGLTGAYRLIHGAGDGLPGFQCDVLGDVAVIWVLGEGLRALGKSLADAVQGFAKVKGVVVKLRARGEADAVKQDVVGTVDEKHLADEGGVAYEIHALSGLNTGLFTDMREQRLGMKRFVGARVLNLFSYTGALGLAAARGGAERVTNVDTSQGVQAWAAGNFARAGFSGDKYRFEQGDAIRYLARAQKDKEQYDLVIIDPPTFSPARGAGGWVLDRDYPNLIGAAASVVRDGGILWLAANTHDLSSLAKLAAKGIRAVNRSAQVIEQGGLPPEYPTVIAQPSDRYLQICASKLAQ